MPSPSASLCRGIALAIGLALAPGAARAQVVTMPRRERRVEVPPRVEDVLKAIDATGKPPPGHIGGGDYRNSGRQGEQLLPRVDREGDPIEYRTWDVHPQAPGRGRGAERLVTGSDGSAYYTPDDYRTFVAVRNPARSTHDGPDHARTPPPPPTPGREPPRSGPTNRNAPAPGNAVVALDPKTAARVNPVVDHVLAHNAPPPEHVGGRDFGNFGIDGGAVLPRVDDRGRPIRYREWDVNRKVPSPAATEGAERIVTGSDGPRLLHRRPLRHLPAYPMREATPMDLHERARRLTVREGSGPFLHLLASGASDAFDLAWALSVESTPRTVARVVRGSKSRASHALFDEVAAAWQFPPYFGENWDALDECLADLEWLRASAYVLFVADALLLLGGGVAGCAFRLFVEVVSDIAHAPSDPRTRASRAAPRRRSTSSSTPSAAKKRP